ncbi:unnamed protein product [Trichobilharzia szidati]|nr:unnamed protein product [Trichobilharzia szidati]
MTKSYIILAFCLSLYVICIEARTKDYDKNLGRNAVTRLCGMERDSCLDDINCCEEYQCNANLECQLRPTGDDTDKLISKECVTDMDCPHGLCCVGQLYARKCSRECFRIPEITYTPAGGYYGQRFWNIWAHKRQLDRHHY